MAAYNPVIIMKFFRYCIFCAIAGSVICGEKACAVGPGEIAFHNESADTVRLNNILTEVIAERPKTTGDYAASIARRFIGVPYVAHTLEGEEERLTVNLDELDCTTFVESVAAMALTASEGRSSWRDYVSALENLRYRNGTLNGYGSRLHYISDWIVDNSYRGNLREITNMIDGARNIVKTIDFMTSNRDRYPALADSATFERIRSVEQGYRNHRYMYIPATVLKRKQVQDFLHDGDLVALTSTLRNLDVTHMGMIIKRDGVPYLMHASSSAGKVVVSEHPLPEFLRRNRQFTGVRILRLRDL